MGETAIEILLFLMQADNLSYALSSVFCGVNLCVVSLML